jgi:hypothetical protein
MRASMLLFITLFAASTHAKLLPRAPPQARADSNLPIKQSIQTFSVAAQPIAAAAAVEIGLLAAKMALDAFPRVLATCIRILKIAVKLTTAPLRAPLESGMQMFGKGCKRLTGCWTPKWLRTRVPSPQRCIHACMKSIGGLPLPPIHRLAGHLLAAIWKMVLEPGSILTCELARASLRAAPIVLPAIAGLAEHRSPGSMLSPSHLSAAAATTCATMSRALSARPRLARLALPAGVAVGGVAAARAALRSNEGLARSFAFNRKMVPMAVEYKLYRWLMRPAPQAERDATFKRLHDLHAPEVLAAIWELRGFYIKIGQVLSSFGDSFVPAQFVDALSALQDSAPAQPADHVRKLVESEIGAPLEEIFSSIDLDVPLGAASIGQVHAATLKNGLEVVVKVMYPDAERFFRNDIRCLKMFCRVFSPENVELMEEIEKQFGTLEEHRDADWAGLERVCSFRLSKRSLPSAHLPLTERTGCFTTPDPLPICSHV